MVLKNSKWDKQAKHKYLKKHGLLRSQQTSNGDSSATGQATGSGSKWKRGNEAREEEGTQNNDEDDENWSDADDEVLNEMFPELGSVELTKEQRDKVKHQILMDLLDKDEAQDEQELETEKNRYNDGIYLGTRPGVASLALTEPTLQPTTLEEYFSKDIATSKKVNRKLPKHKLHDDFLAEYGIDSYNAMVKTKGTDSDAESQTLADYNSLYVSKQHNRPLSKILTEELTNFRIGKDTLGGAKLHSAKSVIKELDPDEHETFKHIEEKAKQAAFVRSMRARFAADGNGHSKSKVLEINNFNLADASQLELLERRLQGTSLVPADTTSTTSHYSNTKDFDLDGLLHELNAVDSFTGAHTLSVEALKTTSGSRNVYSSPIPSPQPWLRKNEVDDFLGDLESGGNSYVASENQHTVPGYTSMSSAAFAEPRRMPPPSTDEDFLDDLLG